MSGWMEWACDEDVESVWIRQDLADAGDITRLPNLAGLIDPSTRLLHARDDVMTRGFGPDAVFSDPGPYIWQAHPEDAGDDVQLYRRFDVIDAYDVQLGEVLFGASNPTQGEEG